MRTSSLSKNKLHFSWARFYEQFKADFRLWCYFVAFQQLFRLYFICTFASFLSPKTKLTTILFAMAQGLRFDSLWATCWLATAFLLFTLPSLIHPKIIHGPHKHALTPTQKYRQYIGGLFTIVTAMIYIASIEYFREYKDLFDQVIFNWFYDDKIAIIKTILSQHHVIRNGLILALIVLCYTTLSRHFIHHYTRHNKAANYSLIAKTALSVAILALYIVGFRGSIGPRPIQVKDAGITQDTFLNKAVVSPYTSLKYAINNRDEIDQTYRAAGKLPFSAIQTIAKKYFNTAQTYPTLAKYLQKTAKGSTLPRPKHIFIIVGESLDAWSLQKQYDEFNLTPNLHKIIADKNAIYFKYFLSSTYYTMGALNTIMTGIPDSDMHINHLPTAAATFPTTLATQLHKLGFTPQFFYGGYLTWQRVEDFARAQDYANIYGAAHMQNWQQTNEWGVDDRTLFNFIVNKIKTARTPTFNLIMTTSNHPPFSIDLDQEGFHKEKTAQLLAKYPNPIINPTELGHIWYSDKTIAEFIKKIVAIDNTALFIITGDHYSKRHMLAKPPIYDTAAVPLIIYGPKINNFCKTNNCKAAINTAGSHLDIGPTLLELVAPRGFTYNALSDSLLMPRKINAGFGHDRIITPDYVAVVKNNNIMYFDTKKVPPTPVDALKERFHLVTNIAQYIVNKGDV